VLEYGYSSCRSLETIQKKRYEYALYQYMVSSASPGVKVYPQYKFKDCRNRYPLAFVFALFYEDELVCLIECDERQHSMPGYDKTNDLIKIEYCKKNNIPLIRVPYWEIQDKKHTLAYLEKRLAGLFEQGVTQVDEVMNPPRKPERPQRIYIGLYWLIFIQRSKGSSAKVKA
jgi:hypothetical protein